jgi:DNA gyrase subunit A
VPQPTRGPSAALSSFPISGSLGNSTTWISSWLLNGSWSENGYGKRTEESEYRIQGRGGKGIIDIKTTDRNGAVVGVSQVSDTDEIVIITNKGMLIRTRVSEVSVIGRNTQGVRMITLESADEKVSGIAKVAEVAEAALPGGDDGGNGEGGGGGEGNGAPDGAVEMPPEGGSETGGEGEG